VSEGILDEHSDVPPGLTLEAWGRLEAEHRNAIHPAPAWRAGARGVCRLLNRPLSRWRR
jgi:hypothetical protein